MQERLALQPKLRNFFEIAGGRIRTFEGAKPTDFPKPRLERENNATIAADWRKPQGFFPRGFLP
jgi:hypothetical protein